MIPNNPNTSSNKEKDSGRFSSTERQEEKADIVELGQPPKLSPELEGYLERVEKEDYFLKNQVLDDQTGQTLITSPQIQKPKIVLPLTLDEYHFGLKESLEESWRWLAEWSKRLIKLLESEIGFKS